MLLRLCAVWLVGAASLGAQQPFYTDDADVTAAGHWHFEFSNQFAVLPRAAYPNLHQNAAVFQLNYGLPHGVELGVDSPLLVIHNAPVISPRLPVGIGDTNLTLKWKFRAPAEGDERGTVMALAAAIESPTGDTSRQLGSGLADYSVNYIVQKALSGRATWRLNNGLIFSGNTLTGVVGLYARGWVYTGGSSWTRQIHPHLVLGVEVTGAATRNAGLGKGQLQAQAGGKWLLHPGMTLDFGILAGHFIGSPRFGAQVGVSKDF